MTQAADPPTDAERRRLARRRTFLAGKLAYGEVSIGCTIRNLSLSGALIQIETPVALPRQVQLLVVHDGVVFEAEIVWRNDLRIGLRFGAQHDVSGANDAQVRALQQVWKEMTPR